MLWTLEEYVAHRFILHNSVLVGTYASHRAHHRRPKDARKLYAAGLRDGLVDVKRHRSC